LATRDELLATVREDFVAYRATVQTNFPATMRIALAPGGACRPTCRSSSRRAPTPPPNNRPMQPCSPATASTKARNKAGATLTKWVVAFHKQAKTDLRKFPESRAQLGR
jgi:hypothetical protein